MWTSSRAWARRSSLAFYEVVMAKAFRTLVDDGTEVSVETGLRAAEKLQSVLDGRERGTDVLELKVQLGKISEAVRSVVPQSMWGRSSRSWSSTRRPSTSERTPSMKLMMPTTRPSSSTRTTSFDLRLACRHRGRWDRCRCGRGVRGRLDPRPRGHRLAPGRVLVGASAVLMSRRAHQLDLPLWRNGVRAAGRR